MEIFLVLLTLAALVAICPLPGIEDCRPLAHPMSKTGKHKAQGVGPCKLEHKNKKVK